MLPTVLVYIELYVEIEAAYIVFFSKSKNCSSLIVMKKLAQS